MGTNPAPSNSSDVLWYAYRTDTDYATLVGPEYVGTAGWHPDNSGGAWAAEMRARYYYAWLNSEYLVVSRDRPADMPPGGYSNRVLGWVQPLNVDPAVREKVTQDNLRAVAEHNTRKQNPVKG